MTTAFEEEVECFFCGTFSKQVGIGSTNMFGSPDLDTRPAEMQRSTICYWVQRCPSCGYCSDDLSEGESDSGDIIKSNEYQRIVHSSHIPKLAASFLANSYEMQKLERYSNAAWCAIHAAWICDDENNIEAATGARKEALSLIEQGNIHNDHIAEQKGASEAITIDLLRRTGLFLQAEKFAGKLLEIEFDDIIQRVIQLEMELIKVKCLAAHTISEAFEEVN